MNWKGQARERPRDYRTVRYMAVGRICRAAYIERFFFLNDQSRMSSEACNAS